MKEKEYDMKRLSDSAVQKVNDKMVNDGKCIEELSRTLCVDFYYLGKVLDVDIRMSCGRRTREKLKNYEKGD